MNLLRIIIISAVFCCAAISLSACSSQDNSPVQPLVNTEHETFSPSCVECNRTLIGTYTMEFNPEMESVTITPNRLLDMHYDVTTFIPVTPSNISVDPLTNIWTVDVTLANTFALDGYDMRLIIYTDNSGIKLQNPDEWTGLWDIADGMQINPFKAYVKDVEDRKFTRFSEYTETLQLYMPSLVPVNLAVDVSYPGNCEEPYKITAHVHGDLIDHPLSSVTIDAIVSDHQDDVAGVHLYCPIIAGDVPVPFEYDSRNIWRLELANTNGAEAGTYCAVIVAASTGSGSLALYDMIDIDVIHLMPEFHSVNTWGGSSNVSCSSVSTDEYGNIYTCGMFSGTVDFGDGNPITAQSYSDSYVLMINNDDTFGWVRHWGLVNTRSILYSDGDIYVVGSFQGTVNFGNGKTGVSVGGPDAFLLWLQSNGNTSFLKTWGSDSIDTGDNAVSISHDSVNDYLYVTGAYAGDVGLDGHYLTLHGGEIATYLAMIINTSTAAWVKTWGGVDSCTPDSVLATDDGVYSTGIFSGTVDFGDGNPITASGGNNTYFNRFNILGEFDQVKTWDAFTNDLAKDSNDNVYLIGSFDGAVDFGDGNPITSNGLYDIALCKYSSDMTFEWVKTWGSADRDMGSSITVDNFDSVYFCGYFSDIVDFGNGAIVESNGERDAYFIKLDDSYNTECVRAWGGASNDSCNSITSDNGSNIYTVGEFRETVDFGDGNPITSLGEYDAYLVHWAGM